MSTSKKKQFVRPETKIRKINGIPQAEGGKSADSQGMLGLYATGSLPDATNLPDGCLAVDTTLQHLVYTSSGAWVTASGV